MGTSGTAARQVLRGRPVKIFFCGVGALGSMAATLCRTLPATLAFADFNRVEPQDLRSQAYTRQSVGENRAEALRLQLGTFYGVDALAYPVRLTGDNIATITAGSDLLVDCLNDAGARQVVLGHCRWTGTPSVHAALSAGVGAVVRWGERFVPEADSEPADGDLPFTGLVAGTLATIISAYARTGVRRDAVVPSQDG